MSAGVDELITKARQWAASFKGTKGAERLNSVYYITALADALEASRPRTIATEEELTELLADDDRSVTLLDSGGFVWWSDYTSSAGNLLTGCAGPKRPGETGMAIEFWGNAMRPAQAIKYGPFTIIQDSREERP